MVTQDMNQYTGLAPLKSFSMFVGISLLASACTSQAWYEGIQYSNKQECLRISNTQEREACIQRAERGYKEYLQKKQEVEKGEDSNK